jgi:hypothetical protein
MLLFLGYLRKERGPFLDAVGSSLAPHLYAILSGSDIGGRYVFEDVEIQRPTLQPQFDDDWMQLCSLQDTIMHPASLKSSGSNER